MTFKMLHPADQIVMIMNRIYYNGQTTTSGGNLSVKDAEGNIWISPSGVDKGTLTRKDIMQIKPDGTIIGIHKPSVEYPIHMSIYRSRPDISAILHAHPPALVSLTLIRKIPDTSIIPSAAKVVGEVSMAPYACPGSKELADNINAEFKKGINTVLMENHGVIIGKDSLFEAFMAFETLDCCARIAVHAGCLKHQMIPLSAEQLQVYNNRRVPRMDHFIPAYYTSNELAIRAEMCTLIKRAYNNKLFTSTQGTFSCRIDDSSFVITPHAKDRMYLDPEDLVRIKHDMCEEGKTPSKAVDLHAAIYAKHPEIQSIIIAIPSNIMAFAVTDVDFNALLIPESYIALRDVEKIPYGMSFQQPEAVAEKISLSHPVLIERNDCVITVGTSLLNAFDRLEVMDYSARSLIYTSVLAEPVVNITDEEVKVINEAFHLN